MWWLKNKRIFIFYVTCISFRSSFLFLPIAHLSAHATKIWMMWYSLLYIMIFLYFSEHFETFSSLFCLYLVTISINVVWAEIIPSWTEVSTVSFHVDLLCPFSIHFKLACRSKSSGQRNWGFPAILVVSWTICRSGSWRYFQSLPFHPCCLFVDDGNCFAIHSHVLHFMKFFITVLLHKSLCCIIGWKKKESTTTRY